MAPQKDKPSYWELLKHPKWQRKRLEIMERAKFACEACEGAETTLNVHHTYYEKGRKPWEYPNESLKCLCADCHAELHDTTSKLTRQLAHLAQHEIEVLYGYALGLQSHNLEAEPLDVFSDNVAIGLGACWGLDPNAIMDALVDGCIDSDKLMDMWQAKNGGQ